MSDDFYLIMSIFMGFFGPPTYPKIVIYGLIFEIHSGNPVSFGFLSKFCRKNLSSFCIWLFTDRLTASLWCGVFKNLLVYFDGKYLATLRDRQLISTQNQKSKQVQKSKLKVNKRKWQKRRNRKEKKKESQKTNEI